MPYVYRSEGQNGRVTYIATCPHHARDLTIHPNQLTAVRVRDAHERLFHDQSH